MAYVVSLMNELLKPLNIIRLTISNIEARVLPALDNEEQSYLAVKLSKIESQIDRAASLMEGHISESDNLS